MNKRALFIGGTGIISSACSPRAVEKGFDLYLLNRGTSHRATPEGARVLNGDIRDPESVRRAIGDMTFDCVVDWIAFTPEHVQIDLDLFRGRTGQYMFISSASAYQTPPASLPVTEGTVLDNPIWQYSRNKIACEEMVVRAYREEKYPITIVRPSHTYDVTCFPWHGGWTVVDRIKRGKPVITHGDGSSLWVMTHHKDFAKGFVGLMANDHAIGEAFHITSDELLTWDGMHEIFGDIAGRKPEIVHVPSDVITAYDKNWGDGLLGDKTHSMIFDNSKIKRVVSEFSANIPFAWGAREVMAWHEANPDRCKVDPEIDSLFDRIIAAQKRAMPS